MKILYLTPWYPSTRDSMSGLFVEKIVDIAKQNNNDCRVISETNLWNIIKRVRENRREWGKPDVVHMHVATKQGIVALWMKHWWGVRYVLTEHWSGYLTENGDYEKRCNRFLIGGLYKRFTQKLVREASVVTAVSGLLRENMRRCGLDNKDFRVVYNVVDEAFEEEYIRQTEKMSFLHVSCFDDRAKNVFGIIKAAASLRDRGVRFRLTMVGDGPDWKECRRLAEELRLEECVRFTGVLPSEGVVDEMRRNRCFVLFSNYETAGVVLQEALAMGMKIISTPVGVAMDYKSRIRIVNTGDIEGLADAMSEVDEREEERVSFRGVGAEYLGIYRELI